ncbi:MAG: hypothetical protein U0270_39920 [Labilithrix sp.]
MKPLHIVLRKLSEREHILDVDGDGVTCETRSLLRHDLLHYAVEAEAGLASGFWGNLARGVRVGELGDMAEGGPELLVVERLVGALDGAAKGQDAAAVVAAVRRYDETSGVATPAWLTEALVLRVQERMRRLLGEWRATPFGGAMELTWPPRSD